MQNMVLGDEKMENHAGDMESLKPRASSQISRRSCSENEEGRGIA